MNNARELNLKKDAYPFPNDFPFSELADDDTWFCEKCECFHNVCALDEHCSASREECEECAKDGIQDCT